MIGAGRPGHSPSSGRPLVRLAKRRGAGSRWRLNAEPPVREQPLSADPYFGPRLQGIRDDGSEPQLVHLPQGTYYKKTLVLELAGGVDENADIYGKTRRLLSTLIARIKQTFLGAQASFHATSTELFTMRPADVVGKAIEGLNVSKNRIRVEIGGSQVVNRQLGEQASS